MTWNRGVMSSHGARYPPDELGFERRPLYCELSDTLLDSYLVSARLATFSGPSSMKLSFYRELFEEAACTLDRDSTRPVLRVRAGFIARAEPTDVFLLQDASLRLGALALAGVFVSMAHCR